VTQHAATHLAKRNDARTKAAADKFAAAVKRKRDADVAKRELEKESKAYTLSGIQIVHITANCMHD